MCARKTGTRHIDVNKSSIVIVCEGTESEFPFFSELVKLSERSSDDFKIVPDTTQRHINKTGANIQKLRPADSSPYSGSYYYQDLQEEDDNTYKKYKAEPIKWVRATQLYMEREKFAEGWAVYDLDNKRGGRSSENHQKAYELAQTIPNLNIAFSAYSFEEWVLSRYERCHYRFSSSDSKDAKLTIKGSCGVPCGKKCKDAKGCIAGYIRKNHNPNFGKGGEINWFLQNGNLSELIIHKACVNAAWLRNLNQNRKPHESNPYTDVDRLVMQIMRYKWDINWQKKNVPFKIDNAWLKVNTYNGSCVIALDKQSTSFNFLPDNWHWVDADYRKICKVSTVRKLLQPNDNSISLGIKPPEADVLCFSRGSDEIYFELS